MEEGTGVALGERAGLTVVEPLASDVLDGLRDFLMSECGFERDTRVDVSETVLSAIVAKISECEYQEGR